MQSTDYTHRLDQIPCQSAMPVRFGHRNRKRANYVREVPLLNTCRIDDPIPPFARECHVVRQVKRNAHPCCDKFTSFSLRHAQMAFGVALQKFLVMRVMSLSVIQERKFVPDLVLHSDTCVEQIRTIFASIDNETLDPLGINLRGADIRKASFDKLQHNTTRFVPVWNDVKRSGN